MRGLTEMKMNSKFIFLIPIILVIAGTVIFVAGYKGADGPDSGYSVEDELEKGYKLISDGDFRGAVTAFNWIVAVNPQNEEGYLGLADAHIALGEINKASKALQNGLKNSGGERIGIKLDALAADINAGEKYISVKGLWYDAGLSEFYLCMEELSDHDIEELDKMTEVTVMDLSLNDISDISVLKGSGSLVNLNLGGNRIFDVTPLGGLENLTELYLWDNQISDISALKGLNNLNELYLWDNMISDISALKSLSGLEYLSLEGNPVSAAEIEALKAALPGCEIIY
jgi:tetratricopeptide (TPR) repeat protein